AEHALERVARAAGDGDLRHVTFLAALRQLEGAIRNRVLGALVGDVDVELAAPLADLNDDRDVLLDRDVLELEGTRRVRERADERVDHDAVARLALDAVLRRVRERRKVAVRIPAARDVDLDVVEGIRARRIVDLTREGGRVRAVALHLLALEARARLLAGHE